MSQKIEFPIQPEACLHEILLRHTERQVVELDRKASDALEAMLSLYLDPEAFAVLKRFHVEFDEECGNPGFTFKGALNELGGSSGLESLQRTLRRVKKEQRSA